MPHSRLLTISFDRSLHILYLNKASGVTSEALLFVVSN